MKLKNKLFIIFIMTLLIFFLRIINVLQYENELANPFVMASMIAFFSFITISIQEIALKIRIFTKSLLSKFEYFKIHIIYFGHYFTFKTISSLFQWIRLGF